MSETEDEFEKELQAGNLPLLAQYMHFIPIRAESPRSPMDELHNSVADLRRPYKFISCFDSST